MYFIFGIISVILVILSVITAVRLAKTERETRVLSALHWFTIGIFAAVLAIFIPVCYTESSIVFGDPYHDLRPLLLAVHSTLRVFIVDVDFEHFAGTVRAAAEQPEAIYVLYTVFSTALFVLAPILTFTNVLSLFRNLHDEFLFAMMKRREFYITRRHKARKNNIRRRAEWGQQRSAFRDDRRHGLLWHGIFQDDPVVLPV
ncbi:MAG: hypothetical protein J6C52_11730 [Clostridia bacterium]|nr:hypothetical protein [Clostridia bacterium]